MTLADTHEQDNAQVAAARTPSPPPPLDTSPISDHFGMSGRDMVMFWLVTLAVVFLCMVLGTLAWCLIHLYLGG